MSRVQKIVLALLLIAVGVDAGIIFGAVLGDIPAIQRLSLESYAAYWQALDHNMGARMPFLSLAIVLLYVIAVASFGGQRGAIFWTLLGCATMEAGAIAYQLTLQVPVNHAVQALDLAHLDLAHVQEQRDATVKHFLVRMWLIGGEFAVLTFGVVSGAGSTGADR